MIVERLEQELKRTEGQLAEVTARTRSAENDAVALHLRKTIAKLAGLLNRIDPVLADAVDEFPTIFDFTTAQANRSVMAGQVETVTAVAASPDTKPAAPAATPLYDEHSLAKAAERVEWSRRMREKGYVSEAEHNRYVKEYEALKARIDADLASAADRVDWARRMFEKGYVSKEQYRCRDPQTLRCLERSRPRRAARRHRRAVRAHTSSSRKKWKSRLERHQATRISRPPRPNRRDRQKN